MNTAKENKEIFINVYKDKTVKVFEDEMSCEICDNPNCTDLLYRLKGVSCDAEAFYYDSNKPTAANWQDDKEFKIYISAVVYKTKNISDTLEYYTLEVLVDNSREQTIIGGSLGNIEAETVTEKPIKEIELLRATNYDAFCFDVESEAIAQFKSDITELQEMLNKLIPIINELRRTK